MIVATLTMLAPARATADVETVAPFNADVALSGSYIRTHQQLHRCLNARGASSANLTPIILWDCSLNWNNLWNYYNPPGTNYNYIYLVDPNGNARCLNAKGGGTTNGTPIILFDCVASVNNVWYVDEGSVVDDIVYIKTVGRGNRCVNAYFGGIDNGTPIILYDCVNAANNAWDI